MTVTDYSIQPVSCEIKSMNLIDGAATPGDSTHRLVLLLGIVGVALGVDGGVICGRVTRLGGGAI